MTNSISSPKTMTSRLFNGLFILLVLCSLFVQNSFSQPKSKPTSKPVAAVTKPPVQKDFIMCAVMPGSDVVPKSPFTLPFTGAEAWPVAGIKTGCKYTFKNAEEQAAITIGLTDLGSSKNALTSYNNAYQASKELWNEVPAQVIVLQDTGFFAGKDECGIKFHLGKYILDINFKGEFPTVTDTTKQRAGIELAEMVIKRLSYLWKPV